MRTGHTNRVPHLGLVHVAHPTMNHSILEQIRLLNTYSFLSKYMDNKYGSYDPSKSFSVISLLRGCVGVVIRFLTNGVCSHAELIEYKEDEKASPMCRLTSSDASLPCSWSFRRFFCNAHTHTSWIGFRKRSSGFCSSYRFLLPFARSSFSRISTDNGIKFHFIITSLLFCSLSVSSKYSSTWPRSWLSIDADMSFQPRAVSVRGGISWSTVPTECFCGRWPGVQLNGIC